MYEKYVVTLYGLVSYAMSVVCATFFWIEHFLRNRAVSSYHVRSWYEGVYLPLYKVALTPVDFRGQDTKCIIISDHIVI